MMIVSKGFFLKIKPTTEYLLLSDEDWKEETFKTFGVPSFASEYHENQELVFESTQKSSMFYKENLMCMLSISIAHVF
jgi:hypothetical protein